MITERRLSSIFHARSASVRVEHSAPKTAVLTISLVNGEYLSVSLPRHSLKRFVDQAKKAMNDVREGSDAAT